MNEIQETKLRLYNLLASKAADTLTDNEIDLMYYLALDPDIQSILDENFQKMDSLSYYPFMCRTPNCSWYEMGKRPINGRRIVYLYYRLNNLSHNNG